MNISNHSIKRQKQVSDLAVIKPMAPVMLANHPDALSFSRWLASIPMPVIIFLVIVAGLFPMFAYADTAQEALSPIAILFKWIPVLLSKGFVQNLLISFFTMLLGTILGIILGLGQISIHSWLRVTSYWLTQIFRNSPWLVLLFIIMLSLPFQIKIGDLIIDIPDWYKAVIGLALPIMANISEIVRGAIMSVPNGQWEAAESLAFSRIQTLWRVILPQTIKRMIPPWMNWYAILTMATPLVSILGVDELVTMSRQAMEAENNDPALLVPFYSFCLVVFFIYTYPIARFTIKLEKKYAVKL